MKKVKSIKPTAHKKSGKVKKAKKEIKAEGVKVKPRLDKYARGGGIKHPHKTQVNVMVGGQKQPVPVPVPVGGDGAQTPIIPPSGVPPMMTPAGMPPRLPMGAPPMIPPRPGMKRGGSVKMTAGAGSGVGRLEKAEHAKKIK